MAEKYNNKVVLEDGTVVIDISQDTADSAHVLKGCTFHDKAGSPQEGACTYDADTSDATAGADEILAGKTGYVNGKKVTGTMPNRAAVHGKISTKAGKYTIPQGYHDNSGYVEIDPVEQAKLVPGNLRKDVTILGVIGTMSGTEEVTAETREVSPTFTDQIITPDASKGYNYLAEVKVKAIKITYTDNAAGGQTVTIGG